MKIGILREEKIPADKRVAFSPIQCKRILNDYPNIEIQVQSSDIRCFADAEYTNLGISVVEDIRDCDILFGIKEVPKEKLIANKTYLYFSHTIKEQEYNRDLLKKMISLNIQMIDYEVLKHQDGSRILGFGRYAGIIGAYNGLLTYGLKKKLYSLKPAYMCVNRKKMEQELNKVKLTNEKFLITDLKSLANKLEIPAESKKYQYMLGKDYPRFKQVMNIVLEASDSASGDFGVLMLRSAEAGGIRGIAGQLASAATAGGAAAAPAAEGNGSDCGRRRRSSCWRPSRRCSRRAAGCT